MKRIKIILLGLLLCMGTGCSVEYNLNFKDKVLSENIQIDASNTDVTIEQINRMLEEQIYQQDEEQQSYQVKQNNKKIQLSQKYNVQTIKDSPLLSQCYTAFNFMENEDYYDLTTSETFTCNPFEYMYIDDLQIKIKTNHKVLSHNADEKKGNTYIWNVTKENVENKPIQIRFSKEIKKDNLGLIILGITVIIAIIILGVVLLQKKNNNQI